MSAITLRELSQERWQLNDEEPELEGHVSYRDGAGDLRDVEFHENGMAVWACATPQITTALYAILSCAHVAGPPCAACRAAGWAALRAARLVP